MIIDIVIEGVKLKPSVKWGVKYGRFIKNMWYMTWEEAGFGKSIEIICENEWTNTLEFESRGSEFESSSGHFHSHKSYVIHGS